MPERKTMRRMKECLRLYFELKVSQAAIARALQIARSTVGDYIERARKCGKPWADLNAMNEEQMEALLFTGLQQKTDEQRPLPDWNEVHKELHSKSYLTLRVLWEEYIKTHPDEYSYPRYTALYRQWAQQPKVYMRQRHIGGEKLFVDYSGKRPKIRDFRTGEEREASPAAANFGPTELLSFCVDAEYDKRRSTRQTRLLRDARIKHSSACVEEIDFKHHRNLTKDAMVEIMSGTALEHKANILISRPKNLK